MKNKLREFKNKLIKLIYPNHIKCIFCGDELNQNEYNDTCENCIKHLPFINFYCARCGLPKNEDDTGVCISCKTTNFNFVNAISVFEYKDEILKIIHKFKFSNGKYLFKPMARFMAERFSTENCFIDLVTDVPMFPKRLKERGYNQASLLAKEFSELLNLKYVDCCERIVDNKHQTELNFKQRRENVKDCFSLKSGYKQVIKDKTILIIDDVFTTGATVNEISNILLKHGAKACYVLTLAHTVFKDFEKLTTNN